MAKRLTEALVDGLAPCDRDQFVFDAMLAGFALRVTPAGRKVFIVQTRAGGVKRRVTIGYHPEISVAEARAVAHQMTADLRSGKDPTAERHARAQAIATGAKTIAQLAELWMTDHVRAKLKPRTVADYELLLAKSILPALGHLTVTGITRADVSALHAAMKATPRRANYTIRTVQGMLTFACANGMRPPLDNPVRKLKLYREGHHERFLSEDEIGKAAEAIDEAEREGVIGPHAAAGLRLALFTGARSGEITAAKWSHVDWQRKFIRLPDSKTNDPRTIHLSDAALEVLRALPRIGPYVIAGANEGEPYKNLSRAWIIAREKRGLNDVRLHDLRHSYASLAAGRGVSLIMIGKLLGHKAPATTQRYAHLARDAVAAVNDELGDAMTAAIAKAGAATPANVTKLKIPKRRAGRGGARV
jgi:integrase